MQLSRPTPRILPYDLYLHSLLCPIGLVLIWMLLVLLFLRLRLPPEEKVFLKGIPGYPLPEGKRLKLKKTIYGLKQAPINYFRLCKEVYAKCGLKQLESDECVFMKYAQNIKGQSPLTPEGILESGTFCTMSTVPKDQRVFASCVYPVACLIIVTYTSAFDVSSSSRIHELLLDGTTSAQLESAYVKILQG